MTGGSVKDAGVKPAYLMPLQPLLAREEREIYGAIWEAANPFG